MPAFHALKNLPGFESVSRALAAGTGRFTIAVSEPDSLKRRIRLILSHRIDLSQIEIAHLGRQQVVASPLLLAFRLFVLRLHRKNDSITYDTLQAKRIIVDTNMLFMIKAGA